MIIALLLTTIVMIIAFFIASVIQETFLVYEESTSHGLWLYGVTLTLTTLVGGTLFLIIF